MKILIKFFARIIGLKHIKFTNKGIFLFDFPMFLFPIELHKELIKKLSINLGINKTKEIYYISSLSQGKFAVDYFKKKFNIHPNQKDLSFYLEQIDSMGLGLVRFKSILENKEKLILNFSPIINFENKELYDFYLEGIVIGGFQGVFSLPFEITEIKKEGNNYKYTFRKIKQNLKQYHLLQNYNYKNISYVQKQTCENLLFKKLKSKKKLFYLENSKIFFNNQNYFFTLLSVYISIYYLSIIESSSSKNIFFDIFEKFGKEKYLEFKSIFSKNNLEECFELLNLFGFGSIKIIFLKHNEMKFEIFEDIFSKISKNLFPNKYSIIHNDLKIGFINGIFKELFKVDKTEIVSVKKLNKLIVSIKNI